MKAKFRVYDKAEKKWLFDYETMGGFSLTGEVVLLGEFAHEINLDKLSNGDYIIEMFTGLHDKNGKEIYEGDVLKVQDANWDVNEDSFHVVEWDESACTYPFRGEFGDYDVTSLGWAIQMEYSFEIIGNIHENPELTTGKEGE